MISAQKYSCPQPFYKTLHITMPFHSAGFPIDNVKNPVNTGIEEAIESVYITGLFVLSGPRYVNFKKILLSFEQNTNEIKEQV